MSNELEDIKRQVRDELLSGSSQGNLEISLAYGLPESEVKALRSEVAKTLAEATEKAKVKPVTKAAAKKTARKETLATEKSDLKAKLTLPDKEAKFYLKDPATGFVKELKRTNSSAAIVLLVHS